MSRMTVPGSVSSMQATPEFINGIMGEKWTPGVVSAETGPVSYTVNTGSPEHWRRHADQMLDRHAEFNDSTNEDLAFPHTSEALPEMENTVSTPATHPSPEPGSVSSMQATPEFINGIMGEKWTPGVVSAETGPVSYTVNTGSPEHWRRHADQMLDRHAEFNDSTNEDLAFPHTSEALPEMENTVSTPATHPSPEPGSVSSMQATPEFINGIMGEKWTPGVVSAETGPVSYTVNTGSPEHWRRHADQMLDRHAEFNDSTNEDLAFPHTSEALPEMENTVSTPATHPSPEPGSVSSMQATPEFINGIMGEKWTPGVVSAETGPVSYTVNTGSPEHWRRHADQMLDRHAEFNDSTNEDLAFPHTSEALPEMENTVSTPATHPSPEPGSVSSMQATPEFINGIMGEKWTPGVVSAETGPVSYTVNTGSPEHWRRHADQMLDRHAEFNDSTNEDLAFPHTSEALPEMENTVSTPATHPSPEPGSVSSMQATPETTSPA
ncbi:uncharacterized protein LOC143496649 [Brachyhypopomus gauderio]|uniref:uncharacterized protein LOC143496649 n=1 Tax=Brachyhypopomus gauderio TaxID=698409 RepID=UPI0040415BC2